MVLGGLGDEFYLLLAEPAAEVMVGADDASGGQVVHLAALADADVVHGGGGVGLTPAGVMASWPCCVR